MPVADNLEVTLIAFCLLVAGLLAFVRTQLKIKRLRSSRTKGRVRSDLRSLSAHYASEHRSDPGKPAKVPEILKRARALQDLLKK